MLTGVARDRRWPDVFAGISVRFSKSAFVLFCYITNHLMTGPLGNSEFCFPQSQIHCSPQGQSLSVKCYDQVIKSYWLDSKIEYCADLGKMR